MRESKKQLKERIEYLEERLRISDIKCGVLSDTLDALQKQLDNMPKDCKLGKYCRACVYGSVMANELICQKGEICKSFTPKKGFRNRRR